MTVLTRFAPSPTGMLHIGNARAALFNFLFARHHGGKFLLRIEDTDKQRSTQAAIDVILEGLSWLDLCPDEPPVYQSARRARHAAVARQLLAEGKAYKCFCTQEELAKMREEAAAQGKPPRYNGFWRDRDPSEAPAGSPYTIRIKAPREGETVICDLVQGDVRVENIEMDDMIILRADGTPTYQHAVVCDDHDMKITHVIRGDDHLTNSFRQSMIYRAVGWPIPHFAHLPLIHGPDGAKLSKRHGAQSIVEFREMGFLPEAVCNYLLRLGWGHGDDEILSRPDQIRLFDLDGVGRSPSRIDYKKLNFINGVWLRKTDDEHLISEVIARLRNQTHVKIDDAAIHRIRVLMPELKERARTLIDLTDSSVFLCIDGPIPRDEKTNSLLSSEARSMLKELKVTLANLNPFSKPTIEHALRQFANDHHVRLGKVAQPLRVAVTGSTVSPGIDATLAALGRELTLRRIEDVN